MKVKVDWDLCESNALCMRAAPEIFQIDDDDKLQIAFEDEVPAALRPKLEQAVRACPRAALAIED